MNLAETVYLMAQKSMKAAQLTDLKVGTVTAVGPLEITIDPAMPPLPAGVLLLTEPVIEKKIPVLTHSHLVSGLGHSHSVTGLSHLHNTGGLGHAHTVDGLGHTHTVSGLGHTHTTTDGTTGSALGADYPTSSSLNSAGTSDALPGSYPSDTQLTGTYPTDSALGSVDSGGALSNIVCYENGQALPVENGYIILNRALEAGDKVLLLRVQNGQKFIVLSRIFEEVS